MSKRSFVPDKTILMPMHNESLVSYGDRLLWHQLALQMNGHQSEMLSEEEYVSTVKGFYPAAEIDNLKRYRGYFNNAHKSLGFRGRATMPIPVEFAKRVDATRHPSKERLRGHPDCWGRGTFL